MAGWPADWLAGWAWLVGWAAAGWLGWLYIFYDYGWLVFDGCGLPFYWHESDLVLTSF